MSRLLDYAATREACAELGCEISDGGLEALGLVVSMLLHRAADIAGAACVVTERHVFFLAQVDNRKEEGK